jgi:chromosome segregation ATPase
MSAVVAYLQALLSVPVAIAAVAGVVIGRLAGALAGGSRDRRTAQDERRVRAQDAELRVAQKTVEQQRAELDRLAEELRLVRLELATQREESASRDERLTRLKADLQNEFAKTARLRQELSERAEELVRSQTRVRDLENELGVARAGSDVILEQVARLEQERDDLNTLVRTLREELVVQARSRPAGPPGRDPVLGA